MTRKHHAGTYQGTDFYHVFSHWNGAEGYEVAESDNGRQFWRDRYGDRYTKWGPVKWLPPAWFVHPWRE